MLRVFTLLCAAEACVLEECVSETTTTSLGPRIADRVWNFLCLSPGLPQMSPLEFQVAPLIEPFQGFFVAPFLPLTLLSDDSELVLLVVEEDSELVVHG